jgi:hypothetical protein
MATAAGPHTRHPKPGFLYRGSKRRVASLKPYERLPATFWIVMAIALFMLGVSVRLILIAAN